MITSRTHDRYCYLLGGMRDALVEAKLYDLAELMNLTMLKELNARDAARFESQKLDDAIQYGFEDR